MANQLSPELLSEIFGQVSSDPFLMLATLSHPTFAQTIYLVSNTVDIESRGQTYQAFPMNITLPADDGESAREVFIEFDNVSLELISELRKITTPIDVKIEMVLASLPDDVQVALEELKMGSINYNEKRVRANLYLDNFLNTEMTSEKYVPSKYPGIF
jgi:hypothetical protein